MELSKLIENKVDELEERQSKRELVTGVPTGFSRLDQLTSGFQPGNLITICGASGAGKRALAYCIARNAAVEGNMEVDIINLSLLNSEATMRFLCAEARVDSSRIRSGFLSRDDWRKLANAAGCLTDAKIRIDDISEYSLGFIRFECSLLIIDSFQRLPNENIAPNIAQEQAGYKMANKLKTMALLHRIPIIVLSSLNDWRIAQRSDKRPRLSDFKYGYSALADTSDVIISVYRDEMYNTDENNPNRGTAEVIVSKQRTGPTGTAVLTFLNSFCRFENLANEPT